MFKFQKLLKLIVIESCIHVFRLVGLLSHWLLHHGLLRLLLILLLLVHHHILIWLLLLLIHWLLLHLAHLNWLSHADLWLCLSTINLLLLLTSYLIFLALILIALVATEGNQSQGKYTETAATTYHDTHSHFHNLSDVDTFSGVVHIGLHFPAS